MSGSNSTVGDLFEDMGEYESLLEDAQRQASSGKDIDFVDQMVEKFETYADRAYLSIKQANYLRSIAKW